MEGQGLSMEATPLIDYSVFQSGTLRVVYPFTCLPVATLIDNQRSSTCLLNH